MLNKFAICFLFGFFIFNLGCAPKVYVIDRATILEEEVGGEWPNVDEALRFKLLKTSPQAIKTENAGKKNKLTRVLEPDESLQTIQTK